MCLCWGVHVCGGREANPEYHSPQAPATLVLCFIWEAVSLTGLRLTKQARLAWPVSPGLFVSASSVLGLEG